MLERWWRRRTRPDGPPQPGAEGPASESAEASARLAAARFRLARQALAAGRAGPGWTAAGTGAAIDFQDQRPYAEGDDLRQVNWSVFARTDHLVVKLHRRENPPEVDLALDASGSLGSPPAKAVRARELALWVLQAARAEGAFVRAWVLTGASGRQPATVSPLEPGRLPPPAGRLAAADLARVPWRPAAVRVLVSDLLFAPQAEAFDALARPPGCGAVLCPWAEEEASPDWADLMLLEDTEGGPGQERRFDAEARAAYLRAYRAHLEAWSDLARRRRVILARVPATGSLLEALRGEPLRTGLASLASA